MGHFDYSGGYVIHLAAGVSGFVAAWVIGPRLAKDRCTFPPTNLMLVAVGAGMLWLGWNGFNGGDSYFAGANACGRGAEHQPRDRRVGSSSGCSSTCTSAERSRTSWEP